MKRVVVCAYFLVSLSCLSSVSGMHRIEVTTDCEVANGLTGMNRDILFKLFKIVGLTGKRNLIAMHQIHFLWTKNDAFKHVRFAQIGKLSDFISILKGLINIAPFYPELDADTLKKINRSAIVLDLVDDVPRWVEYKSTEFRLRCSALLAANGQKIEGLFESSLDEIWVLARHDFFCKRTTQGVLCCIRLLQMMRKSEPGNLRCWTGSDNCTSAIHLPTKIHGQCRILMDYYTWWRYGSRNGVLGALHVAEDYRQARDEFGGLSIILSSCSTTVAKHIRDCRPEFVYQILHWVVTDAEFLKEDVIQHPKTNTAGMSTWKTTPLSCFFLKKDCIDNYVKNNSAK